MDGEQPSPGGFGDAQRRLAALMAEIAADYRDDEQILRELTEGEREIVPGGFDHLAEMLRNQHDGVELLQRIAAEQAIAYDEMVAAGGPDNPEAYEQYRQTTERLTALVPRWDWDN